MPEPHRRCSSYILEPNGRYYLIDAWEDQDAIDRHHASPMMKTISDLREKYDLHMTVERYVTAEENAEDEKFIKK